MSLAEGLRADLCLLLPHNKSLQHAGAYNSHVSTLTHFVGRGFEKETGFMLFPSA